MGQKGLVCLFAAVLAHSAWAGTISNVTWSVSAGDTNWANTANWNPQTVPQNTSAYLFAVTIGSATYAPRLGADATIYSLMLTGATLSLDPGVSLTLHGGASTLNNATLSGGMLVNRGTLEFQNTNSLEGTLQNDTGAGITVGSSAVMVLTGGSSHTNNGTINLTGDGVLGLNGTGTVTLGGSGSVILRDSAKIVGVTGTSLVNATGHTIEGVGSISAPLTNAGTILANGSGTLTVMPGAAASMTNSGLMAATAAGSTLAVNAITLDNGGTIRADQGTVTLAGGSTVAGGTLEVLNGGVLSLHHATGSTIDVGATGTLVLQDNAVVASTVTNNGTIESGAISTLSGALTNNGAINIGSSKVLVLNTAGTFTNQGTINVTNGILGLDGGPVTLSGSGNVTLSGTGAIAAQNNGALVNGTGHTIQGVGTIYAPLTNGGNILANQSGTLSVGSTPAGITNGGLMAATVAGSVLNLNATAIGNTGGTIRASYGTVNLADASTVTGGIIEAVNGGMVSLYNTTNADLTVGANSQMVIGKTASGGNLVVNATGVLNLKDLTTVSSSVTNNGTIESGAISTLSGALTNSGTIHIGNSKVLVLNTAGTFTNNGTINVTGNGILGVEGGTVTLGGTGNVVLSDTAVIAAQNNGALVNGTDHTIQGVGTIYAPMTNGGNILANQSGTLTMASTAGGITNSGLMAATVAGSVLDLNFTTIDNAGGIIRASYGTVNLADSSTVTGGRVEALNGGVVSLDNATNANLQVGAGSRMTVGGTVSGGGTVQVDATGVLNLTGNTTVTSAVINNGTIHTGAISQVFGEVTNNGTINVGNGQSLALSSAGTYTNNGIINVSGNGILGLTGGAISLGGAGTVVLNDTGAIAISADSTLVNGASHTIQALGSNNVAPGVTLNNQGTLMVGTGGELIVSSLSNYSSNTLTGGTYDLAGALRITGVDIETNAADLTLRAGGEITTTHTTPENALHRISLNTGSISLVGAALETPETFVNQGAMIIDSGSTFSTDGDYRQTAGSTRVDGTLNTGDLGLVGIEGGTLSGSGTINGNLYNLGRVAPGNSPGTLTVNGHYVQGDAATLQIEILSRLIYDRLVISESATLDGTLDVKVLPGALLSNGDIFTIMTFDRYSGMFDHWNLPHAAGGTYWTYSLNATNIELEYHTPEPAAWGLAGAGLVALWLAVRRRCA